VKKIFLCGYTPTPIDRFGRPRGDFAKVSLGAEKSVAWEQAKTLASVVKKLRQEKYLILAIEQSKHSTSLFDYRPPKNKPFALILGSEVRGLSPASLKHADTVLEIPMHGHKESLNVSVAAGIALFTLLH